MKKQMLTMIFVIVFALSALADTFSTTLGKEKVQTIVREVVASFVKEYNEQPQRDRRAKVQVGLEFPDAVSELILNVKTSLKGDEAGKELRKGFRKFLENLTKYVAEHEKGSVVVIKKEHLDPYLKKAKEEKICGEIPCDQPPCCANCAPCPPRAGS